MSDDEGILGHPIDSVEMIHAMFGLAKATWTFYDALIHEGFTPEQAMTLTGTWIFGTAGGKQA